MRLPVSQDARGLRLRREPDVPDGQILLHRVLIGYGLAGGP